MYGAFPIIFAKTRRNVITSKKYKRLCYWINAAVLIIFVCISLVTAPSGAAYLLWTSIFSSKGRKILEKRGLLIDQIDPYDKKVNAENEIYESSSDVSRKVSSISIVPEARSEVNLNGSDDPVKSILEAQAKETIRMMEINRTAQIDNEGDPEFGIVPEKPIYTMATEIVDGQRAYLSKLRTVNGEKITWERLGSTSVDGVNGLIDIYETFLPSGVPYKTLYINMYGAKTSQSAPSGFYFVDQK